MMTHRRLPLSLLLLTLALAGCPDDPVADGDAARVDMRTADVGAPDMRPDAARDAASEPELDMAAEPEPRLDMGGEPEPPDPDMGGEPEPPDPDMGGEPEPEPDRGVGPDPLSPRPAAQACRLPEAPPLGEYVGERAFPNLSFSRPLWLGNAPGDPDTMFLLEQGGTIYAFDNRQDVAQADRSTFLTIDASRAGNEEGLLGLAFHPNYAENGRFFVYYSGAGAQCGGAARCSILSEFRRAQARRADPGSERIVLRFAQPFSNHNGGDIHFGPDGYLYVSVGDGGSGGDPLNSGQTTSTLLGSILRLDIDDPPPAEMQGGGDGDDICNETCQHSDDDDCDDGGPNSDFSLCEYGSDCIDCGPRPPQAGVEIRAYRIPPGNPFADGVDGRPEIYTWGMRNVWRMAFDAPTGVLWAGDVGQNAFEEIDKIEGPGNFGWNVLEGTECYRGNNCPCPRCTPIRTPRAAASPAASSIAGSACRRCGAATCSPTSLPVASGPSKSAPDRRQTWCS